MLNKGKIQVGTSGAPNQISYGNQSPMVDAVPLLWSVGDHRYYMGNNPAIVGWVCTVAGAPGTWVEIDVTGGATGATGIGATGASGVGGATGATGPGSSFIDLFLSYGDQSADGALPSPPEATPSFYLRPNTNKTVQMSFSGSPGATWEYEVAQAIAGTLVMDIYVYSCGLTPAGVGPATLQMFATVNGAAAIASGNLDGLTNTRVPVTALVALSAGFRIGILCETVNVGSGFLMATAHLRVIGS